MGKTDIGTKSSKIQKKQPPKKRKKVIKRADRVKDYPGAPPKFVTPDEFEKKCQEYFVYIQGEFEMKEVLNPFTDKMESVKVYSREPEPSTITGLALFLGFESRQSFYDYEKTPGFSYTVKKNRTKIENGYEKGLFGKYSTGAIFGLKNFGWSDKQEIDHKSSDGSMSAPTPIRFTKGSKEK